jgi:hypothetical protein
VRTTRVVFGAFFSLSQLRRLRSRRGGAGALAGGAAGARDVVGRALRSRLRWRCARGRRAARSVSHAGCSLRRRLPILCRRDGDAPNHRCEKAHSALSLSRARLIPRPICSVPFSAFRGAARARVSVCLSTSPLSLCLAAARGRRATSTRRSNDDVVHKDLVSEPLSCNGLYSGTHPQGA